MKINDVLADIPLVGKVVVLQPSLVRLDATPIDRLRRVIDITWNDQCRLEPLVITLIHSPMFVKRSDLLGWIDDEKAAKFLMWNSLSA